MSTAAADRLREEVRKRYADAASSLDRGEGCGCDCASSSCCQGDEHDRFGRGLYGQAVGEVPERVARVGLSGRGVSVERRIDLRKPKEGKGIGETGLSGEDGA